MRIKVDDEVEVISGNYKGVRGTVSRVYPKRNLVVVSGVNVVKKAQKAQATGGRSKTQAGIIEFEAPFPASKVLVIDPETGEPTRIGYRRDEDGRRIRYAKKSGAVLS